MPVGAREEEFDSLEPEFPMVVTSMGALETEIWSSARVVNSYLLCHLSSPYKCLLFVYLTYYDYLPLFI